MTKSFVFLGSGASGLLVRGCKRGSGRATEPREDLDVVLGCSIEHDAEAYVRGLVAREFLELLALGPPAVERVEYRLVDA